MKKMRLDLDELQVVSFEASADEGFTGTVNAHEITPLCSANGISCDTCVKTCDTCTPC